DSSANRLPSTPWWSSLVPVASWSRPGGGYRFDAHEGVVVRHLARGVDDPTADEHVPLGPVDLYVPRSDRSETQATPIGTEFVRQLDFVSLSKVHCGGVLKVDEVGGLRPDPFSQLHEDFPFGTRLADSPPRDLGGEVHAPFRGSLRTASPLLVSRLRGEQQDGIGRIHEHRAREDDV